MNQFIILLLLFISFCLLFSLLWAGLLRLRQSANLSVMQLRRIQEALLTRLDHLISWKYVNYLDRKLFVLGRAPYGVYIYLIQIGFVLLFLPLAIVMLDSFLYQFLVAVFIILLAGALPTAYLHAALNREKDNFLTAFGFFLDLLKLCLTSGASLNQSLKLSSDIELSKFLAVNIQHLIDDLEQGTAYAQAWSAFGRRCDEAEVDAFVFAVLQAHKQGMSLATILQQQSERIKTVLFVQAEKKALALPTKLIFPILVFIFPTTFIVISFPLLLNLLGSL